MSGPRLAPCWWATQATTPPLVRATRSQAGSPSQATRRTPSWGQTARRRCRSPTTPAPVRAPPHPRPTPRSRATPSRATSSVTATTWRSPTTASTTASPAGAQANASACDQRPQGAPFFADLPALYAGRSTKNEAVTVLLMIEGRTLWELIDRRAQESPDALFLTDEAKRTMTFAEHREAAERAGAGLDAMGIGEGTAVTWQLPTWIESFVLVAALSRLGAVQNPVMPIYRQREVGFVAKQTGARLLVVPTEFRGFDYKAMADEIAGGLDNLHVLVPRRQRPERA